MAIGDCERCWDAVCCCGWDYRDWSIKHLEDQKRLFDAILEFRKQHPDAQFSGFYKTPTADDEAYMIFIKSYFNTLLPPPHH